VFSHFIAYEFEWSRKIVTDANHRQEITMHAWKNGEAVKANRQSLAAEYDWRHIGYAVIAQPNPEARRL